jgi:hypothetical protein
MFHASSPRSVALPQLRFTSLAVVSLREDLHLRERAHAGRTIKNAGLNVETGIANAAGPSGVTDAVRHHG